MAQRVIYLEGHVRQTLPVVIEVPDDFKDDEERLTLSSCIMRDLGDEIPFDFWQPFNTKITIGEEGKAALKVTRLKEGGFKVEKMVCDTPRTS